MKDMVDMNTKKDLLKAIEEYKMERSNRGMNTDFLLILDKVLSANIPFDYSPADFVQDLVIACGDDYDLIPELELDDEDKAFCDNYK